MNTLDVVLFLAVVLLSQLYKLLGKRYGLPTGKRVITFVVVLLSFVVAWLFGDFGLPVCSIDMPAECVQDYVLLASALVGAAMTFYNLILEKLFQKIGAEPPLG